jgi:hypothetical protein
MRRIVDRQIGSNNSGVEWVRQLLARPVGFSAPAEVAHQIPR